MNNDCSWKANWPETREHFKEWWEQRGIVAGQWTPACRSQPIYPGWEIQTVLEGQPYLENSEWRASYEMSRLARMDFPADTLPCSSLDLGPVSLCTYLGSEPHWAPDTIWYSTIWEEAEDPTTLPPLCFNPENHWWKITEKLFSTYHRMAEGKVLTPINAIGNGLDVLASLRGPQTLSMDMLDHPEWVREKLNELYKIWFEVYERLYQLSKQPDNSSACSAFRIWGPGRTALLQCDFSALISVDMFREFEIPGLKEICSRVDYSMFHVDGRECLGCLDAVLEIEELDAVEWSPGANRPNGASPVHFEMYHKILDAGKSLQITDVSLEETLPLLKALGRKGVYVIYFDTQDVESAEDSRRSIENLQGKLR